MTPVDRPKVAVVQAWVRQYRAPFMEALRERLERAGVELVLIHGRPHGVDDGRQDTVSLPWARVVDSRMLSVGPVRIAWQPALGELRDCDLVIVEQATKRLLNYLLFAWQRLNGPKVAFWGHGQNFQPTVVSPAAEAVKRFLSRRVHWWFAYNERSVDVVADLGYPRSRITDVQNAIDTTSLVKARRDLRDDQVADLRRELGLTGGHVGLYCGSLYPDKRLPFLLDAARHVRALLPDFELVVIGDGVDRPIVEAAAQRERWIHYVGPRFHEDRVPYFAIADALLIPAQVGLVVLDGFALGLPLVTLADGRHSPEVAYLEDGVNGLIVDTGTPEGYAEGVAGLLTDAELHARLAAGCERSAHRYTVEHMADRFTEGVLQALRAAGRPAADGAGAGAQT